MRRTFAAALALGCLAATDPARAGELEKQGSLVLAADRLFGFYSGSSETDLPAPAANAELDWTGFGLGWQRPVSPFEVPRLGVDYFVAERVSVGGSVAYASLSDDDDDDTYSAFLLSPRVGYAIPFGQSAGFWIRGGFSWHTAGATNDTSGLALTVEPTFWISLGRTGHVTLGFAFDHDLTGERETPAGDRDHGYTVFGLALGLGVAP